MVVAGAIEPVRSRNRPITLWLRIEYPRELNEKTDPSPDYEGYGNCPAIPEGNAEALSGSGKKENGKGQQQSVADGGTAIVP